MRLSCGLSLVADFTPILGITLPRELYCRLVDWCGKLLKCIRCIKMILRVVAKLPNYRSLEVNLAGEALYTLPRSSQKWFRPELKNRWQNTYTDVLDLMWTR